MSGWEWFVIAAALGALAWAAVIVFIVLWSQANKAAGERWDRTMADHRSHVRVLPKVKADPNVLPPPIWPDVLPGPKDDR